MTRPQGSNISQVEWSGKTFSERPSLEAIEAFKAHVRETGEPHTWIWHRHDAPARDAKPVLLDKVYLPEGRLKNPDLWAKCPLCAPNHAKYTWGYLAWFPASEGGDDCIRAIGHDCGGRFFGDAEYKEALDVFRREQDELAERKLLTEAQPRISVLGLWLSAIRPWAEATQTLKTELRVQLPREFIAQIVRASASNGALTAQREIEVTYVRADGTQGRRREGESYQVARVAGGTFLADRAEDLISLRNVSKRALSKLPTAEALDALDAAEISAASKAWATARDGADQIHAAVSAATAFVAADNISEIQKWSRTPGTDAVAQVLSLDGRPRLSIYRYKRIGIPSMGMRAKVEVEIPAVLRQSPPVLLLD